MKFWKHDISPLCDHIPSMLTLEFRQLEDAELDWRCVFLQ